MTETDCVATVSMGWPAFHLHLPRSDEGRQCSYAILISRDPFSQHAPHENRCDTLIVTDISRRQEGHLLSR